MIESLVDDEKLMQLYLLHSGKGKIEPIMKQTVKELSESDVEMYDYFVSSYELKTFEDELTAVYDYMANGREVDTEAVFESILGIANRVLEKSEMKDTELHEQYKDVSAFMSISQPAS